MKQFGSALEFTSQRNNAIMLAYRSQIKNVKRINVADVFDKVVNMPSPRFWVSEERASIVISDMLRGKSLNYMRPTKREMFQCIFRRFCVYRALFPNRTIISIVTEIVHQPAPKFYMSGASAQMIFYRYMQLSHYNAKNLQLCR
jgi:hypothetical protein